VGAGGGLTARCGSPGVNGQSGRSSPVTHLGRRFEVRQSRRPFRFRAPRCDAAAGYVVRMTSIETRRKTLESGR